MWQQNKTQKIWIIFWQFCEGSITNAADSCEGSTTNAADSCEGSITNAADSFEGCALFEFEFANVKIFNYFVLKHSKAVYYLGYLLYSKCCW